MILFDYGQTLVELDGAFRGLDGYKAVLKYAVRNPYQISAKELDRFARGLNKDIGRYQPGIQETNSIEVHSHLFHNYVFDYYGIEFDITPAEIERIYWDHAAKGKPTQNIHVLLQYLREHQVRTAIVSNISFSGKALEERIRGYFPEHEFEFMIASSEYVFRKPHRRIFELALRKAGLHSEEVWYCGDYAYFDVDGAAKAGIFPVWYRGAVEAGNNKQPKSECLTIRDWMELIEYLERE
jgi:putative hydrolase of the HAD superfamily